MNGLFKLNTVWGGENCSTPKLKGVTLLHQSALCPCQPKKEKKMMGRRRWLMFIEPLQHHASALWELSHLFHSNLMIWGLLLYPSDR